MAADLTLIAVAALSGASALAGAALQARHDRESTQRTEAREDRLRGYDERSRLYREFYAACLALGAMHDLPDSNQDAAQRRAELSAQLRDQLAELLLIAPRALGEAAGTWSRLVQAPEPVRWEQVDAEMRAYRDAARTDLGLD